MTAKMPTISVYHAALFDYLLGSGESELAHAQELGRTGLDAGCGVLHILHVHEEALNMILESTRGSTAFWDSATGMK